MTQVGEVPASPPKMYKPAVVRIPRGGGSTFYGDIRGVTIPDDALKSREFVPIKDWKGYVSAQRLNGATPEQLEYYEAQHRREYPQAPVPPPKKTYNTRPVMVKLKVNGEGVSLVVVENKLATMLREYHSRGKLPPKKVWVEAWIQAGRNFKDVLSGMVRMESRKNERFELLDKLTSSSTAAAVQKHKKILKPVVKNGLGVGYGP